MNYKKKVGNRIKVLMKNGVVTRYAEYAGLQVWFESV
jgi:hypothetical protein